MDNFEFIRKFFQNFKCSDCNNFFTEEAVELIRQEENNIVVRVTCSHCGKALGLAVLGTDRSDFKNSLDFQEKGKEKLFLEVNSPDNPITYEEVAEAHKFFNGLGSDWVKYIPSQE